MNIMDSVEIRLKLQVISDTVVDTEEIYQIMLGCHKDEYEAIMKDVKAAKITAWWDCARYYSFKWR